MSSETKPSGTLGLTKFNTVGREEAAAQVLTPQVDPAVRTRNIIIAIVAALALGGIVWAGFKDTGKKIFEQPANGKQFEPPARSVD